MEDLQVFGYQCQGVHISYQGMRLVVDYQWDPDPVEGPSTGGILTFDMVLAYHQTGWRYKWGEGPPTCNWLCEVRNSRWLETTRARMVAGSHPPGCHFIIEFGDCCVLEVLADSYDLVVRDCLGGN